MKYPATAGYFFNKTWTFRSYSGIFFRSKAPKIARGAKLHKSAGQSRTCERSDTMFATRAERDKIVSRANAQGEQIRSERMSEAT
jgi:hypothetical protein